jgi:ataxin-3
MYLYHEKQESALCAIHALNNLLQGEYFGVAEMMNLAAELDREEKSMMAEMGTETNEYLKYMREDSHNVGLDGNFSIEVIKKALQVFQLTGTPINHPDMKNARDEPQKELAFVCNLSNHWFAIRKVREKFWDLNSLHKAPVFLSEIYLGAFLKQLQVEGYTIYVVRGTFPEIFVDMGIKHWIREPTSGGQNKTKQPEHYYSLKDPVRGNNDDELARAIAASLNKVQNTQMGGNSFQNKFGQDMNGNEDDDLAKAIALSIQSAEVDKQAERDVKRRKSTVPTEPLADEANTTTIMIRMTNGKKVGRRFRQSDLLSDIMNWLYLTHNTDVSATAKLTLVSSLERKKFTEENMSLAELNLRGNVLLIVEEK